MTQRGLSAGEKRQSIPLKGRVTLSQVSAQGGVGQDIELNQFCYTKREQNNRKATN